MTIELESIGHSMDMSSISIQVLEQAPDGIAVVDHHGRIVFFNGAAEALWGMPRAEALGKDIHAVAPGALPARAGAGHCPASVRGSPDGRELAIECRDGERRWARVSVSTIDVPGRPALYCAVFGDVTRQRRRAQERKRCLRAVHDSDSAVMACDGDFRITYVNAGFTRMFGHAADQALGRRPGEILGGRDTDLAAIERIHSAILAGKSSQADMLAYALSGLPRWVSATVNALSGSPEGGGFLCVMTDITLTKLHEVLIRRVLEATVRDAALEEMMSLVCLEVERIAPDLAVLILAVDEAGRLRPLAAPSLPGAHAQSLDGLAAGPQAGPWGLAARCAEAVLAQDSAALPLRQRHASLAWPAEMAACWAIPITAPDGKVLGVFTIYSGEPRGPDAVHRKIAAISVQVCALMLERDRARAHIHELAFYDPLTRLPNRSMLQMLAGPLLDEARAGQQPAALVLIDLDHFKHINDAQGYAAGDALLRDLAGRLQACVRENDIVARLVGDEFVILVPCCGADQAVQLIRRLSSEILALASLDTGLSQHAEASFGVAIFPADGDSLDMLLHHADMAMSQAKANGRNGYCFFSAEINQAVQERAVLEASLRLALREDGLELHYQPQLDIGERRLVGVEALLRWNHPTLGAVSPLRIVALAEAAGLIDELGHWCVSRACAQMAQWEGAGLRVPRVSVNLTAANFKEAELPAFLSRVLREHGLAPRRLTLELTEHGMLEHGPVVRRTIAAIHDHGISLSLDDFGTGYSSLGYLHRLPFDEIKLDKSFIQDLEHNEAARALTTSVLRIGEMLCMRVVAEGVETEFQRRFLAERGHPIIQGYLFARPMDAAQLQQWLADRRRR